MQSLWKTLKQNRKLLIAAVTVVVLVVVVGIIAAATAVQSGSEVNRLLRLGEQYLTELEYEQALAVFQQVIELEPRNEKGYIGAAKAYIGLEEVDSAINILIEGYYETGRSKAIRDFLWEVLLQYGIPDNWDLDALDEIFGPDNVDDLLEQWEDRDTDWDPGSGDGPEDMDEDAYDDYPPFVDPGCGRGDHVIAWQDPVFERMIREAIDRPTGDVMCSELHHITELVVLQHTAYILDTIENYTFSEEAFDPGIYDYEYSLMEARNVLESVQSYVEQRGEGNTAADEERDELFEEAARLFERFYFHANGYVGKGDDRTAALGDVRVLDDIAHFVNLQRLALISNDIRILRGVATLPSLRYLDIRDCAHGRFAFEADMGAVETFRLGYNELHTAPFLAGTPNLTSLSIQEQELTYSLEDISFLSALPKLSYLDLYSVSDSNVAVLEKLSPTLAGQAGFIRESVKKEDLVRIQQQLPGLRMTYMNLDYGDYEVIGE